MAKGPYDRVDYWVRLAQYDLDTADALLHARRYLYVGFMCHQAIEKSLKAEVVRATKGVPPFTHNLSVLAQRAGLYESLDEQQRVFLDELEPLNVESRYPSYKKRVAEGLTRRKAAELLARTRGLYAWLRKQS